jgi:hypothetical protein
MTERSIDPPTYAEVVAAALAQEKAHRVIRFKGADGPIEDLYVVDGGRNIERLPCCACGGSTTVKYTHNTSLDDLKSVIVVCDCKAAVVLACKSANFDRARGAMTSACSSWWNTFQDPENHPDDLGAAGGFVADARAVDLLLGMGDPDDGMANSDQ